MTHLDGLCNHDKILTGACLDCAEEHCVHHGKHPKGSCPICAGLDVYAPALYNADMDNLIERLRDPYGLHYPRCREAADEIERLTAERDAWKESRDFRVMEHLADKDRIAKLERVYEAATNLVRAEGWQIERDNLWDTLHDLIDAEDEAIADMEQT